MSAGPRILPPEAPSLPRRIRLTTVQRCGLPVLFAIPVLALLGLFGERFSDARAEGNGLSVAIQYPSRIHYRQPLSFRFTVRNMGATTADSIVVSLDPRFMRAFTAVQLSAPVEPTYRIKLANVASGERRSVSGDVSGDQYWGSAGVVRVAGPNGELRLPVSTFVFP
jgi:hypothetical protein